LAYHDTYDRRRDLLAPDGPYLHEIENSVLPGKDEESQDDLGDLVATVENEGIEISPEGLLPSERKWSHDDELAEAEDVDQGLPAEPLDKTSDPVRVYFAGNGNCTASYPAR